MIIYAFTLDLDPEDPDFWSVFIDTGRGSSAEIAGRIGSKKAAEFILSHLNSLSQDQIREMFVI